MYKEHWEHCTLPGRNPKMTDKERIIIDGVDVSECPALCCGKTCFLSQHYPFTNPKYKIFCEENQNCDHKQLARKTQECEELKKECEEHKSNAESYCNSYQSSCKVNGEITHKMFKYKQTLDEIKKVCIEDTREFADGTAVRYDSLDDILDIINKAKGNN